jgi:hypothetical protein
MTVRIIAILGGLISIVLLAGALNVSRDCGKFPVDIKVSGTRLASLRYETCADRATAEGYARLARESDEDMRPGQRLSGDTGQIDVPFSDVTSFFGLLTTHDQSPYAVIALTAPDGSKRVRVALLPRHGSANHTIVIAAN